MDCHNRKVKKVTIGGSLEKPGGENCGLNVDPVMGFAKVLEGSPAPPSLAASHPIPTHNFQNRPLALYFTVLLPTSLVYCIIAMLRTLSHMWIPPDYLILSHIHLYQKDTALLLSMDVQHCSSTKQ